MTNNILTQVSNVSYHDVLIIGSGAAGNSLALQIPENLSVAVISKSTLHEGSTYYAQGGISAVLSKLDSIQDHIDDTMEIGCGLCKENVVRSVANSSKTIINWLLKEGVDFTKENNGLGDKLHLTHEGGHSHPRIVHADDKTGKVMQDTLIGSLKSKDNINLFENRIAIDLIISNKKCVGAYIYNKKNNQINIFNAKYVVLATGGANKVYLYTSNPNTSSGDGIAMAYRAGCNIVNMEFMQFHPTCLYHPEAKSFLISEAVRGEGGKLILPNNKEFMHRYDSRGVLSPRDIVARAIDNEMKTNGFDYVLLDIRHKGLNFIEKRFPYIYDKCKSYGIDMSKDPIPVVPAAHYTCGGIQINENGKTNLDNLYAIGEVAYSGLHGANRMASNSLLECIYFANQVLEDIKRIHKNTKDIENTFSNKDIKTKEKKYEKIIVRHCWKEVRTLMWDYVGIVRNDRRLIQAHDRINIYKKEIDTYFKISQIDHEIIELRNLIYVAKIIIDSSILRKESRGLHYNTNYPYMDDSPKDTNININNGYQSIRTKM